MNQQDDVSKLLKEIELNLSKSIIETTYDDSISHIEEVDYQTKLFDYFYNANQYRYSYTPYIPVTYKDYVEPDSIWFKKGINQDVDDKLCFYFGVGDHLNAFKWLKEECEGVCKFKAWDNLCECVSVRFETKQAAMLFKLTWCGEY